MSQIDIVADALKAIYDGRDGGIETLQPTEVVDAARDPAHVLHQSFEWDDAVAGERFRIGQARNLIRLVTVTAIAGDEERTVRYWHAARNLGRDGGGYVPESDVRESPEERAMLLRTMMRDWASMKRRYQNMTEFWDLVVADREEATAATG